MANKPNVKIVSNTKEIGKTVSHDKVLLNFAAYVWKELSGLKTQQIGVSFLKDEPGIRLN